ncbi:putative Transmembrane protein [Fasciolopsis buskii]|uniref:Store-operated calcium entry-associated regulatory factor n=1 Tax=Fasciolopsis buskii TaxID=27845 RepID=A0A8E0RTX8_9TREM|nr:putative Transmembrane protein [Fasciolopsis buski]
MTSFWRLALVIGLCLTSLGKFIAVFQPTFSSVTAKRVLLRDITALTFARGQNTHSRRSNAIPQLKCIGGSAYREWDAYPSVAQCYNRGYDGQDVQWECRAELPKSVFLGRVRVSCEGYDYPDDPYILSGSCGLEYELEYTGKKRHNRFFSRHILGSSDNIKYAAIFGLLGLAALIWYCCLPGSRDDG